MPLPPGKEVYNSDNPPIKARGISYTARELTQALKHRVVEVLQDREGRIELQALIASVATTQFDAKRIDEILGQQPAVEDWRVGEAIAESYLVDHRGCEFPWPTVRDLKNPSASPAGADLVGFGRLGQRCSAPQNLDKCIMEG